MSRLYIKPVKIRRIFPPNNELAAIIARICILREDAMIEMLAILEEDMGKLDRPDAKVRKFYFMRNLIRTHLELSSAIQTLLRNSEFKQILASQPEGARKEFEGKLSVLKYHPILKGVRNDICGNVRHDAVQDALNEMNDESFGFFQVGDSAMKSQFGFASEIVAAMLLRGVSQEELNSAIGSEKFRQLRACLELASVADHCFVMYAPSRGIYPW